MAKPLLEVGVYTSRFNHTEVKPNFINPCCVGEDFATWMRNELSDLASHGFELSLPIQEDYGWGLWASRRKDTFWIAISSVQGDEGDRDDATEGEWVVTVTHDPGLNPFRRLFGRADPAAAALVADRVRGVLEAAPDARVVRLEG